MDTTEEFLRAIYNEALIGYENIYEVDILWNHRMSILVNRDRVRQIVGYTKDGTPKRKNFINSFEGIKVVFDILDSSDTKLCRYGTPKQLNKINSFDEFKESLELEINNHLGIRKRINEYLKIDLD